MDDFGQYMDSAGIAAHLGVKLATVHTWRSRGRMPQPDRMFSRTPLWRVETVRGFVAAKNTRRERQAPSTPEQKAARTYARAVKQPRDCPEHGPIIGDLISHAYARGGMLRCRLCQNARSRREHYARKGSPQNGRPLTNG